MLGRVTSPPPSRPPKPDDPPILSGVIANRYRIEKQIGEGGMAQVFLATDITRDVKVAVKVPKPELVMQLGAERFGREVQITTRLQHPLIVPVLDSGFAADGVPFYVMPFIEGESLEQRLTRTGALPIDEAIAIASDVLDGLIYAHKLGFVHRDVKPANVMLTGGHALLADFGIARAVETGDSRKLTESGFALGTAEYMSPEQAAGDTQLDGRSDIYSLACVVYEMLVGGPPFTAPTARGVMARHFVDPVPSIRTVRDTVPVKLEMAVLTALSKTPVDRFADAAAFKAALKDPTLHQVTAAVRPPATPAQKRTRVVGGVLAVLALAGGTLFWRARTADAETLDPNRVMVYPFVLPEGFAGPRSTGEDVATIIGNALDGADPLKWIDGWALLDATSRESIRGFSNDAARQLARGKRCAYFVTGRLSTSRDSVQVSLTLYDVRGDSVVKRGVANGTTADPWKQGLRAVNQILPSLIRGSQYDMSNEWKNRDPGAVANFLLGESAFRRLHMQEAVAHYRKAISEDSTFAFAALRGAQAAAWFHRGAEADSMVGVALAQPLPPRYRSFALGIRAYVRGEADSAAAQLKATVAADPEMAVAWAQLGEVYTHLLPVKGPPPDSLAYAAFARARQLDSSAASGLLHPIEFLLRRGDTTTAAPLIASYLAASPDSALIAPVLIERDCIRRGADGVNWRALAARIPLSVLFAAKALGAGGLQLACTRAGFQALLDVDTLATEEADSRRSTALVGLQAVDLARGAPADAITAVDRFMARWGYGNSGFLFGLTVAPTMLPRAQDVAQRDSVKFGVHYAQSQYGQRLWKLGVFEAHVGHAEGAQAIAADLHRRALAPDSTHLLALANSLDALAQLARGTPADSVAAERALMALLALPARGEVVNWDESTPRGIERLTLARLLHARGAHQDAIAVANIFDSPWPLTYLQFLPASLELRARAAKALGNSADAAHFLARLSALRGAAKATGG